MGCALEIVVQSSRQETVPGTGFSLGTVFPIRSVNAAQAGTFGMLIVQDFEGVAIEDGDDGAGEISGKDTNRNQ